jgi:hypothetical protein
LDFEFMSRDMTLLRQPMRAPAPVPQNPTVHFIAIGHIEPHAPPKQISRIQRCNMPRQILCERCGFGLQF